jgi:hypothetical protein
MEEQTDEGMKKNRKQEYLKVRCVKIPQKAKHKITERDARQPCKNKAFMKQ